MSADLRPLHVRRQKGPEDSSSGCSRDEKCGMRGSEIEVGGNTRLFLGVYLCGGSIRVRGDAGDFAGAANQKGTIFIGGCTYLPGAEMTKGTITVQEKARILSSYQKTEIISIKGEGFQKYVGDMAEKGAGEVFVRVGSS